MIYNRTMRKLIWLGCLLLFFFSTAVFAAEKAIILDISGPIGPATLDYVKRGIQKAVKDQAKAVILQINTPGGLENSMRDIDAAIIDSPIPVIAYVFPAGARAASAGVFLLYASHLAAMAPGTNVGAASPVSLMGDNESKQKIPSTMDKKVMNDAVATIRSLAELRGRNPDWAEKAVRQASSISASQAKQLNVINEIANDYPQLLEKLDGKNVIAKGQPQTIKTKNLSLTFLQPDWRYKFLSFITNPNIAYLLMLLALYGLFFELSNPGLVLPGVAGIIALLIVLYAFQLMPINYAGLTLIFIGLAFMAFEVYVSSFGVIGIGGIIAFIVGSIMLFDINNPNYQLNWGLILAMSAITATLFFLIANLALRSHKKNIVTGQEGLIGSVGTVYSVMNQQIVVRVLGEIWEANSSHQLHEGQKVKVTNVKGLVLTVEPIEKSGE